MIKVCMIRMHSTIGNSKEHFSALSSKYNHHAFLFKRAKIFDFQVTGWHSVDEITHLRKWSIDYSAVDHHEELLTNKIMVSKQF